MSDAAKAAKEANRKINEAARGSDLTLWGVAADACDEAADAYEALLARPMRLRTASTGWEVHRFRCAASACRDKLKETP